MASIRSFRSPVFAPSILSVISTAISSLSARHSSAGPSSMACGFASASLTATLSSALFLTISCRSSTMASRSPHPTSTPTLIASSSRAPPSAKSLYSASSASPAANPPSPPPHSPPSSTNSLPLVSRLGSSLSSIVSRFNRHLASPCYRPVVLHQKLSIAFLAFAFLVAVNGAQTFHAPDSPTARPTSDDSQSPSTSSILSGTVQDPSGAVISHAIVLLRPSAKGTPIQTETDSSGSFHFEKIPVGSYTLTVAAPAFKDATIPITFKGKRLPPLRVTLALASQSETVTVGGADSSPQVTTDTSQNQSANAFERAALDRVPVFDQDYITTLSRFLDDNSVSTIGVSLVVNGVEANGPGVTPSAIQEVRINQNPYSALFANPGRARLGSPPNLALRLCTV